MNNFIVNELHLKNTKVAIQNGNLDKYWKWKENDGYIPAGAIISNIKDISSYLDVYLNDSKEYASDTHSDLKEINANNNIFIKLNIRMDSIGMTWIHDDENKFFWHNVELAHIHRMLLLAMIKKEQWLFFPIYLQKRKFQ